MEKENFSRDYLLEQGIINLVGPIGVEMAHSIVCQFQYLSNKYPDREIQLWINSPGGEVISGLAIIDIMNYVKVDVQTVVIGLAASMAAVIASNGTKGKRYAFENAEILIHQPSVSGIGGQETDIVIQADNMRKTRQKLNKILAKNSNQAEDKVFQDTERDYIMTAEEAKEYGLIDHVIK